MGITPLFAVFDSHDGITFGHSGLSTPSGDIRLLPVADQVTPLAGQPGFAWAPGRQVGPDGEPWPYDQRTRLEAQVTRAAAAGLSVRAGFELEFFVSLSGDEPTAAQKGPAYSPHALLQVDDFAAAVLRDLAANGVPVGQLHAEYGLSQLEISLGAADPVTAADRQLLARQTIHAAARAHGLRVSFAPLVTLEGVGNGLHLHVSVSRGSDNLLADHGRGPARGRRRPLPRRPAAGPAGDRRGERAERARPCCAADPAISPGPTSSGERRTGRRPFGTCRPRPSSGRTGLTWSSRPPTPQPTPTWP